MGYYISSIRKALDLPYLSIVRIETALHLILYRYVQGSNKHIADLICRIPASKAPATYYGSHNNQLFVECYSNAIKLLNYDEKLNLEFLNHQSEVLNFTTGSSFALTLKYVKGFVQTLREWVNDSEDKHSKFNRYSALVWIQFCLLTGSRPNNGLTNILDIDLVTGWYLVADKPNKVVKNHRLIPLCPTLITLLNEYKGYLLNYQNYASSNVERMIHHVHHEQDDLTLINILSTNYDTLRHIKRGDISKLLADFLLFDDSYFTRHFIRIQLERHNVPIHLINSVIGHEQNRQEALGRFSSNDKQQIWQVRDTFELIAKQLCISA